MFDVEGRAQVPRAYIMRVAGGTTCSAAPPSSTHPRTASAVAQAHVDTMKSPQILLSSTRAYIILTNEKMQENKQWDRKKAGKGEMSQTVAWDVSRDAEARDRESACRVIAMRIGTVLRRGDTGVLRTRVSAALRGRRHVRVVRHDMRGRQKHV